MVDFPLRRLLRIALTGLVCVLAVLAGGRIAERIALGADDAAVRARVERDVRGAFDGMANRLRTFARGVAPTETVTAAVAGDEQAAVSEPIVTRTKGVHAGRLHLDWEE